MPRLLGPRHDRPALIRTAAARCLTPRGLPWPFLALALACLGAAPAPLWTPARADCGGVEPLAVMPADGACPTWNRDGAPQTAHTDQELFELINGGAALYIQYGFVAAAVQNYAGEVAGEPSGATLSLYNQGSAENAEALFLDEGSGTGTPIEDWGGTGLARIQAAFGMTVLDLQEACFFARVLVVNDEPGGIDAAHCLARKVVELIQGAVPAEHGSWGGAKSRFR